MVGRMKNMCQPRGGQQGFLYSYDGPGLLPIVAWGPHSIPADAPRAIFVIGQTAKGLNSVRSVCIQSPYERPGVSCLVREHPSFSYGRFKNYDREHLGSY